MLFEHIMYIKIYYIKANLIFILYVSILLIIDISSSLIELDYKVYQYCNEALTQNNPLLLQRCLIRDNLVNTLLDVNKNELDILEKKFISKECFNNISKFLDTRKMFMASFLLKYVQYIY